MMPQSLHVDMLCTSHILLASLRLVQWFLYPGAMGHSPAYCHTYFIKWQFLIGRMQIGAYFIALFGWVYW